MRTKVIIQSRVKNCLAGLFVVMLTFFLIIVSCSDDDGGSGGSANSGSPTEVTGGGATYYVAPNGSDENPGTEAQALADDRESGCDVSIRRHRVYQVGNLSGTGRSTEFRE